MPDPSHLSEKLSGRTIQIYLPDGNPRGVRIAEITSRTIRVVLVPRVRLDVAATRDEIQNVGVYFLIGTDEEASKHLLYVGQAENCLQRIQAHNRKKDFWNAAIAVVSKTQAYTNTHIRYLEWLCHEEAATVGRYKLDNSNAPKRPHISEPVEADLLDNFESIKTLVSTLGYPIFDEVRSSETEDTLVCKGKKALARGRYTEEGLVVLKGSTANVDETKSAGSWVIGLRRRLLDDDVLVHDADVYKFTSDHLFAAPSGAAAAVLGRRANGWREWRYEDGRTLDQVIRQSDSHSDAADE